MDNLIGDVVIWRGIPEHPRNMAVFVMSIDCETAECLTEAGDTLWINIDQLESIDGGNQANETRRHFLEAHKQATNLRMSILRQELSRKAEATAILFAPGKPITVH